VQGLAILPFPGYAGGATACVVATAAAAGGLQPARSKAGRRAHKAAMKQAQRMKAAVDEFIQTGHGAG